MKPQQSSVLVLRELCSDSLILTKRNENLRSHPGEICFPGGLQEPGDEDLYATALRELHEELGIASERLTLIKELPQEKTLLGVIINPWLANIESITPYKLNAYEVVKLVSVPLPLVMDPNNYREFTVTHLGKPFQTWQFTPSEEVIWGATARIMRHLASE